MKKDNSIPVVSVALLNALLFSIIGGCMPAYSEESKRIITIGGTITEIVCALEHCDEIVAVDATSNFPEQVKELPDLGFYARLSAEGLIAQRPDLILAIDQAGPAATIQQIQRSGIPVEIIPDRPDVDTAINRIERIGTILGSQDKAGELVRTVRQDLLQLQHQIANKEIEPSVLFIYAQGANTLLVAGKETPADAMIKMAGGRNAIGEDGFSGFRPLTPEAVVSANPDTIVMLEESIHSLGGYSQLHRIPGLALTDAYRNKNIIIMEDLYFIGFGPRMGKAVLEFAEKLHRR